MGTIEEVLQKTLPKGKRMRFNKDIIKNTVLTSGLFLINMVATLGLILGVVTILSALFDSSSTGIVVGIAVLVLTICITFFAYILLDIRDELKKSNNISKDN
jgi:membrane-anchored glycerophosphoryl diester phosphodiesterase (GDPDase)